MERKQILEPSSFTQCSELFAGVDTQKITWARWPFRYLLTQVTSEINKRRLLGRMHTDEIVHGYHMVRISAKRVDTGLRQISHYAILPKLGFVAVMHSELPLDPTDEDVRDHENSMDFEVMNGMCAPNMIDRVELAHSLELGRMDGYEPYVPIRREEP